MEKEGSQPHIQFLAVSLRRTPFRRGNWAFQKGSLDDDESPHNNVTLEVILCRVDNTRSPVKYELQTTFASRHPGSLRIILNRPRCNQDKPSIIIQLDLGNSQTARESISINQYRHPIDVYPPSHPNPDNMSFPNTLVHPSKPWSISLLQHLQRMPLCINMSEHSSDRPAGVRLIALSSASTVLTCATSIVAKPHPEHLLQRSRKVWSLK